MTARIVFVVEGTINKLLAERIVMKIKTQVILKATETKMTGVSKRVVAKKKATKKAKETTGLLAHVSREGSPVNLWFNIKLIATEFFSTFFERG